MNGNSLVDRNPSASIDAEDASEPTVFTATSVAEIRTALSKLHDQEAHVTSQLDALVSSQKELQRELGRLDLFRANLSTQASKTRSLSNGILSDASSAANRISSSVKRLDLEQSRVKSTLTFVEQVGELKACVLGVAGSMGAPQDWETAASYLSRASKIPQEVINGDFAARIVPTAEVPDPPQVTLEDASESLCGLFLREFDKAVKENDGSKITRFFKLFPLINRSEVGLDIYGRYVCQGVASRARTNLNAGTGGNQSKDQFFYANALTKLFEHIAQIVVGHGSLVERHYGAGKMTRVVERLQVEADLQGGIILDTWADERRVDRQLTDIKSYAYSFLVQSFLPPQRGVTGTPRSSSPANAPARNSEDEGVDMKQVDALLNEMTMMLGKWSLYTRFLTEKCEITTPIDTPTEERPPPLFLLNSSLTQKVNTKVLTPFTTMTTFFFRRSVEKAFQLDENPPDLSLNPHKPLNNNAPHISSAIDDIMYIVSKILSQSLATCQPNLVLSIIPTLTRVMSTDFLGMIQRKMRDESYPKATIPGALPPEHTIVAFIVLVNDLDVAIDYITQIANTHTSDPATLSALFPSHASSSQISTALLTLRTSFAEKTTSLLSEGIHVLFTNVMKPRLRPILLDAFRDTDYASEIDPNSTALDPEPEAENQHTDPLPRFLHSWTALTLPISRLMTPKTFDQLFSTALTYLARLLEKRLWSYNGRISPQGATRLERDVNSIIRAVVQGRKYGYRDAFLRCTQICMIMNMEEEEWDDLKDEGGEQLADKLTGEERIRARRIADLQGV